MLDHPLVRLLLGVLAAAALGALAARVAVSVPADDAAPAGLEGARGAGAGDGAGAGRDGGAGAAGRGAAGGGAGAAGGGDGGGGSAGGATATLAGGSGTVTVHVTGAVRRPGVYALREGARVVEAVRRAGGARSGADRQRVNLAAPVRDGQQVVVPERAPPAPSGGGGTGAGPDAPAGAPVDLNTATAEQLQTLDGVGPTTAEKILKLREDRGGLGGVDDLDEVPGIGEKKLEALRAQLEG